MAVTRGPYVQVTSRRDSQIIWYTNQQEDSVVKIGLTSTNLNMTFRNSTIITTSNAGDSGNYRHIVRVSGLLPDTQYFYSVGSTQNGTLLAGSANIFFWTMHQKNDNTVKKRVWVVADHGTASTNEIAVVNAFNTFNTNNPLFTNLPKISAHIWIGDNAYSNGEYVDYDSRTFAAIYYQVPLRKNSLFTTLGNHDYYANAGGADPYFTLFTMPTLSECGGVPSFSEKYFSFEVGNIHFISLDGYYTAALSSTSPQYNWLRRDLQSVAGEIALGTKKWIVVFQHFPPYTQEDGHSTYGGTQGAFAGSEAQGDNFRTVIIPLLDTYKVDLALYGHSHVYERSFFIEGYYGNGSNFNINTASAQPTSYGDLTDPYRKDLYDGTVHIVMGNGGRSTYNLGFPAGSGGRNYCNNNYTNGSGCLNARILEDYGSAAIDISPGAGTLGTDRLRYRMVTTNNGIFDDFYIDK